MIKLAHNVYDAALLEYINNIHDTLSTAMHSHKWWSTLNIFLFGVISSLPPIRTNDGFVTYDSSKMTKLFLQFIRINKVIRYSYLPPT